MRSCWAKSRHTRIGHRSKIWLLPAPTCFHPIPTSLDWAEAVCRQELVAEPRLVIRSL